MKMTSIQIMKQEHKEIKRILQVVRKACAGILKGDAINFKDFEKIIDFIRNYADEHHHGKEEKFLFKEMEAHLGQLGMKLIRNGMHVEHDLGRLYIKELAEALERVKSGNQESKLDVIAHAISYTHLLERHIAKEDDVIYGFGENKLSAEILEDINKKTEVFEKEAEEGGIQKKYLQILKQLEEDYR